MLKHLSTIFFITFIFTCCSSTLTVDPYHHDKNTYQNQKKNCKDECKGLTGKARAECSKRCN